MENKKSFILFTELEETVEQLKDDQAGRLFKHILKYVNDRDPKTDELIINLTFTPIKQGLKRDLQKWKKRAEINALNGLKGGRPKKDPSEKPEENKPKEPTGLIGLKNKPKKADNVNDNVNDILLKKETKKLIEEEFIYFENQNLNKAFNIWIKYRKELKKSLKPTTAQSQINFLNKQTPEEAVQIIDESIKNGWTGLFLLKAGEGSNFKSGPNGPNGKESLSKVGKMAQTVQTATEIINQMKNN